MVLREGREVVKNLYSFSRMCSSIDARTLDLRCGHDKVSNHVSDDPVPVSSVLFASNGPMKRQSVDCQSLAPSTDRLQLPHSDVLSTAEARHDGLPRDQALQFRSTRLPG